MKLYFTGWSSKRLDSSDICILIIGMVFLRFLARLSEIPKYILQPFIVFFSFVGAYAMQNSMSDVIIAAVFGVIGYLMRKFNYPLGPFILAVVLGPIIEYNLLSSLQLSRGNWLTFFERPISGTIFVLFLVFIGFQIYRNVIKK